MGMWREHIFSPTSKHVSSLPWLSDTKGITVLAKLEPTAAYTLLSRNQAISGIWHFLVPTPSASLFLLLFLYVPVFSCVS